jgi:hypothetical protein
MGYLLTHGVFIYLPTYLPTYVRQGWWKSYMGVCIWLTFRVTYLSATYYHKLPIARFDNETHVKIIFSWVHIFAHGCHVFETCMCIQIFHPIYMSNIQVLNTQHLCAKNTNLWNNICLCEFQWTNEISKFVISRGYQEAYIDWGIPKGYTRGLLRGL